jgi:WD40 repeat protein/Tfp pilus assembly protein PilF
MLATVAGLLLTIAVGASVLSLGLNTALTRARDAEADATRKLFDSQVAEARATSLSRQPGQRFASLALLEQAARLTRARELPPEKFQELRNAAVAALTKADLYPAQTWPSSAQSWQVDFDDNLEVYARTDEHGNCSVRRVEGDVEIHFLPGPDSGESCVPNLSRDARFVALIHSGGRLRLWQLDGDRPKVRFTDDKVFRVVFHPSGKQLAFSHVGGAISLYDLATGRLVNRLPPDALTREVVIALHPTEPLVAVASYFSKVLQIRDLRTAAVVKSLELEANGHYVAWHPAGHTLAATDGLHIWTFDRATYQRRLRFGPTGGGAVPYFNRAGDRLAVIDWAGAIRLFETATGQLLFQVPYRAATVRLRFDRADRRLAGFVQDNHLGIWQVGDGREYRTLTRPALSAGAYFVGEAVSPDGRLVAAAMTDGVGFWDLDTGTELAFLPLDGARFAVFEPPPAAALLVGDRTGTYRWPIQTDSHDPGLRRIGPPRPVALPPGISPTQSQDGQVLAACARPVGDLQPWAGAWLLHADRPDAPRSVATGADLGAVALSPDGRWLVTIEHTGGATDLWDARTGRRERRLLEHGHSADFSPDGRWLAVGGAPGGLFDVATWEVNRPLGPGGRFAPDSRVLAVSTGRGAVRLIEAATGRELAELEDPNLEVAVNWFFTPDEGRLLTIHQFKGIRVWDLRLIRQELARWGLDWDAPPYPPAAAPAEPLRVQLAVGDFARLRPIQRAANLDRAIQAAPGDAIRWLFRGRFHQEAGRHAQALADLRQAVKRGPNAPGLCNVLAWFHVTAPAALRDVGEAVTLAERAVRLLPGQWTYHNTLGAAYYRAGRYRDAVPVLEASLKGGAGQYDAFDLYFLALCHHRLGDSSQAHHCLRRAQTWHKRRAAGLDRQSAQELERFRVEAEAELGPATR